LALCAFDFNDPGDAAFFLFWVALPVANAVWDYASWWISRGLGADLVTQIRSGSRSIGRKVWTALWHSALDLGAALVLLAALASTLPNVVEWFLPVFADEAQWCAMAREPLGEGLWVTSMLLSTLVPTALHLAAVIASPAAALALRFRQAPEVAQLLERANAIEDESACRAYLESRAFKQAADSAATYFALVRPGIWTLAALFACLGLWGLIHVIWLGLDALLVFLPRIDTLPEFLLGVAYDLDFAKAAGCFESPR
jgi:hypothetical protein